MTTARPLYPHGTQPASSCRTEDTPMPKPQLRPAAAQSAPPDHSPAVDDAREAALERVFAGFVTTISPRSAARLAELLSRSTYVQAA